MTLGKSFKFHGISYILERKCLPKRRGTHSESLVFISVCSGPRLPEIGSLTNNESDGYENVT